MKPLSNIGYVIYHDYSVQEDCAAVQSQKAVSAYFTSKQILPFAFAENYSVEQSKLE